MHKILEVYGEKGLRCEISTIKNEKSEKVSGFERKKKSIRKLEERTEVKWSQIKWQQ